MSKGADDGPSAHEEDSDSNLSDLDAEIEQYIATDKEVIYSIWLHPLVWFL